ncbi:extracellular calcium-sensing receptor-like [Ambystoma mexicanum]|uniref:extracellular calcium-sensing receptor-like n=1 Tax=Ambystoma mexicanum TaxID=8296 RepID=UPI0037E79749
MVFAINEINQNPELLPNISLGFWILDSCMSQSRSLRGVISLLSGMQRPVPGYSCQPQSMPAGVIGELMSSISLPMARILGLYHFPQVSYGSSLSTLSNKLQFPSFLRTVPANVLQITALARLMKHFGWTWIGIITSDDDVGVQGGQDIKKGVDKNGGCVAFMEKIHLSYSFEKIHRVVRMISGYRVRVVIINSSEVHTKMFIEALASENVTDKVLVFSESFTLTPGLFRKQAWKTFNGSIALSPHATDMPGFIEMLHQLHPSRTQDDIFIKVFWEKVFNCKWRELNDSGAPVAGDHTVKSDSCAENQTLVNVDTPFFEMNDMSYSYHTYLAVYAFAHALHTLMSCKLGQGPFINGSCGSIQDIQPWQVFSYLKHINFKIKNGENIFFDANGDAPGAYDIRNAQMFTDDEIRLVKVGHFDPRQGEDIHINTSAILWSGSSQVPRSVCSDPCPPGSRKAAREGEPACCYDCLPCSQGEIADNESLTCIQCPDDQWSNQKHDQCIPKGIDVLSYEGILGRILAVSAMLLTLLTSSVLCVFIKYRDTPIVKANNRGLSYLLLLALMLCFLCSFVFIGHPRNVTCMLRQVVFGIVFSICVSTVLAKTIIVVIAFKATNPNSPARKWLGSKTPWSIVCSGSLIQVLVCIIWLLKSPPFPELNKSSSEKIIFECNEGAAIFFYCMMGYMGLLATISFIVAFLSRNLPGSFNEAKLITFSMLVFVSVWISFIPAYLSTRGKYMVAVEVFAILCSSAGLLCCIFLPKCYIMLLKPQNNTKGHLVGKVHLVNDIRK